MTTSKTTRILIIDDNPDDLVLLRSWLNHASKDYDIVEITNLEQAADTLTDFSPNCVLLDGFLLDGDCFDLLRNIHKITPTPPPVIVISAYDNKAFQEDAIALGAVKFYSKNDLDSSILHQAIQTTL